MTLGQVLVYAQSLLAEQTTPVALNISDTVASVSNVEFVDKDGLPSANRQMPVACMAIIWA